MDSERTFPYISGDRIRLKTWNESRWVRVGGYGQVYFIGTLNTDEEGTYFKDARMAYNDEWELYAPAPDPQSAYAVFDYDGGFMYADPQPQPSHYAELKRTETVWKCRIEPEVRIYP